MTSWGDRRARFRFALTFAFALGTIAGLTPSARAADADAAPAAAVEVGVGGDAGEDAGLGPDRRKALEVRALIAGTLDTAVLPASLFDAPPDAPEASALDAARIRAFLRGAGDVADAAVRVPDGGGEAGVAIDPRAWTARIELERARLAFHDLSSDRRRELLEDHASRVAAAQPKESEEARRTREAEEERKRALDATQQARSEGERLVAEELVRLLGVAQSLDTAEHKFASEDEVISSRKDAVLGWHRRVREARAASATEADLTYDALRRALRATRDELDVALDTVDAATNVPELGPNPLNEIPREVDVAAVVAKRQELEKVVAKLRATEQRIREARVVQLVEEADALNGERLGLLESLSPTKHGAVTGFGEAGWDQARSELRQLTLIVRYHRHVTSRWLGSFHETGAAVGSTLGRAVLVIIPWALAVAVFAWWRRRGRSVLQNIQERMEEDDRVARATQPSLLLRAFRFFRLVRGPLEWLLLFLGMMWLLPAAAQALLEVQLFATIVSWTLAGALVVNVINASFAAPVTTTGTSMPPSMMTGVDGLRLRSLRLIGRVVVAFVLTLVISARLVGRGAIYSWALSAASLAAIPVLLVLVRWWRETVFARIERLRKKSRFQEWALANRSGWKSFLAATSAAVHLFVTGTIRIVRAWVSGFDLTRRAAAYLFRRELDKLEKERAGGSYEPIGAAQYEALGPSERATAWLSTSVDEKLEAISERIRTGKGGVFALVGERGAGKSSVLRRLLDQAPNAILAPCEGSGGGLPRLRARLADAVGLPGETTLEAFGASVDSEEGSRAVLLDDAHVYVRMVMGGLADFDALVAIAREHSHRSVWIVSFDDSVWQFLERARGVRPLFDDVITLDMWSDKRIGELVEQRSRKAGITPSFEDLLEDRPVAADEADHQDALRERREGYYRLIWDYARGNPGVALHVWRGSLGLDTDGAVCVRHLRTPNAAELEMLPYPTLFVLRSVLQLAPASPDDIRRATQLNPVEISDAIRYSVGHGYLVERDGRVDLTWDWFRPITRLLQRRHLLVPR